MLRSFCVFILLACSGLSHAGQQGACGQELLAELPLVITPNEDVYVEAALGDKVVFFSLSMKSGLPLVAEASARALGLELRVVNGTGQLGSRERGHFVKLENLKLGAYRLLPRAAPIMPQPGREMPLMHDGHIVAGVLGSDMFRNVDAELLIAERKLRLYKSVKCTRGKLVDWQGEAARLPVRFDRTGTLIFNMEVNGKLVESTLLSGSGPSALDRNVAVRYLGLRPEDESGAMEVSLGGNSLRLGDVQVGLWPGFPDCRLVGKRPGYGGIGYECLNVVPFQLGTDLLSRMRVYISSERAVVLVAPVPDQAQAAGPGE